MTIASEAIAYSLKRGHCRTVSRQYRNWRQVTANLVRRTGLDKEETTFQSDRHLILLNLRGNSENGEHFLNGKRVPFIRRRPGAVVFIPAGSHWAGWETGESSGAYLSILVDPAFVEEAFSRAPSHALPLLTPDLGCEDPIIVSAVRGVRNEIDDRNPLSSLLVESYITTIFAQLFRRQRYIPSTRKGGLATIKLNRVVEKIDADLTSSLTLSDLSAVADLSVPHFCRAFKQAIGHPPHTFILKRRVERAREYLRFSQMPVTEIAHLCGFSSSSHLANMFRRETGQSPQEFRSAWSDGESA